jgi:putative DNA primase/helicase
MRARRPPGLRAVVFYVEFRMNTIGTESRPLESSEPMSVARDLLRDVFQTPGGIRGLWFWKGMFYEWYGSRWSARDAEELLSRCLLELEGVYVLDRDETVVRYKPTVQKVKDVVRCLQALVTLGSEKIPVWLGTPTPHWSDARYVVGFEDRIVHARDGHEAKRDANWFDLLTVPVDYDESAECPLWERCLMEWGDDDPKWSRLLQQWFGYCLTGYREYAKWLLMYGKSRAGKGTIVRVLEHLMPRQVGGISFSDWGGSWGLSAALGKKVISIAEASSIEVERAGTAAANLKMVLGQDPVDVNEKYGKPVRGTVLHAAPILQCNMIPQMPNEAEGLSLKMLALPFNVSFAGRENPDLYEELEKELPGIAAWAMRGAFDLFGCREWSVPAEAEAVRTTYIKANNPLQTFLESRFTQNPNGFCSFKMLRRQYLEWCEGMELKPVPVLHLPRKIEMATNWPLSRKQLAYTGVRGFVGMSAKREHDDEGGL